MGRLPLALAVALLVLLVALSPMAPLSPMVPEANAQGGITDLVQMSNDTQVVAEFGNHEANGGVRVAVEIGDGMDLKGYARTVNFTVGGTADRGNGKDYTIEGCCSVRLPANRHSAVFAIYVNNDGIDEGDETIVVTLQDGNGYTVNSNRNTFTLTVRDDDTRGLYFSRSWADVDEGGSHKYTVKLRSQPTAPVTINIASNNSDVTVTPTALTFNPSSDLWSNARSVTVNAAQDSDTVDDTAILTHTTSGGDYGGANALSIGRQVSVEDDDPAAVTPVTQLPIISLTGGAAVTEGGLATFTVNANPAPTSFISVNLEVMETPGQDFVAAGDERVRTVFLAGGATSTTFTVRTVNDRTVEDDGYVQVFVNDGSGDGSGYVAGQGSVVTVLDNDYHTPTVSFSAGSGGQREDDGTHEVRVDLTHPAPPGGITLRYFVSGTATQGGSADYTVPNNVTINAGERSAAIPVTTNDDSANENVETVILTLIGGGRYTLGSTTVYTLTITDNDVATQPSLIFVATSSSAAEDASEHEVLVDLRNPAPFAGLTFSYSVSGTATAGSGNDFTIEDSGMVEVWGGATGAIIPVTINDDSASENAETVILTLTGGTGYTLGSTTSHTLIITDNDNSASPVAAFALASSSAEEGDGTHYVRVSLSPAPSGGLSLNYSVSGTATAGSDSDFTIQNSGTLSVGAGASTALIPVAINSDSIDENPETVILTLTSGTGYTLGSATVHTLTISSTDPPPTPAPAQAPAEAPARAQSPAPTPTPTPAPQACNLPADAITAAEVTGWRDALDPNRAAAGIKRWNRVLEAFGVDTGAGVNPMPPELARQVANWLKNTRWDRTARTLEAMAQCNG